MILPRAPFFLMRLEAPGTAITQSHRYVYLNNNGMGGTKRKSLWIEIDTDFLCEAWRLILKVGL